MPIETRTPIWILGAGGHAKEVLATLQEAGEPVAGLLDDNPKWHGQTILGVQVAGALELVETLSEPRLMLAIGDNAIRRKIALRYAQKAWATVVHPRAYVHASATLGAGTVVFAGAVVQPEVRIGAHCILNAMSSASHESVLEDFTHLAPGVHLAGNVYVGEGSLLGVGSVVKPGVRIGRWATVGAGGVVVQDVAEGEIVMGVPARARPL
jgi:sugar O-acyltransferase (sialic acid O-acetyltransferase NeuD family)